MILSRWRGRLPAFGSREKSFDEVLESRLKVPAKRFLIAAIAVSLTVTLCPSADAQSTEDQDLRRSVEELRAENEALKREVAELRAALKRLMTPPASGPGSPAVQISIAGLGALGTPDAPVTIVEFADYENEHCGRFHRETFPRIDKEFVQPGRVRYLVKHFPDLSSHPQAQKAHEAAACAGDQGMYWEMHDLLFANQSAHTSDDLIAYAQTLQLDLDLYRYCLTSGARAGLIRRDIEEAQKGGVPVTPVFAIGLTRPGAQTMGVMRVIAGPQPFAVFEDAIGAVLASANSGE